MKNKGVSAVILAGGNSKRMGQNKALLRLGDQTMIEVIVETLKSIFHEIIVVTDQPEQYPMLKDIRFALDRIQTQEKNSLVGLYTGLWEAKNDYIFAIACDIPLLNRHLIQYMIESIGDEDILIPHLEGHYQPLYAVYGKNCLKPIKDSLDRGDFKITRFFDEVRLKKLQEDTVRRFDPDLQSFFNINTYEEYEELKKISLDKIK